MSSATDTFNKTNSLQILIADDHPILLEGLRKTIEEDSGFNVIAEAGDGMEALRLIREKKPDIAVVDISMPSMDGLEIVRRIRGDNIETEFIILTMYSEEEYFNEAMDNGVRGYILKENATTDLLKCLHAVSQKQHYVSASISGYLIKRNQRSKSLHVSHPELHDLTPTERKILKLISENKTSKEIADELFVSYRTVQNHRSNICRKLNLNGYNRLLQFALENKSNF